MRKVIVAPYTKEWVGKYEKEANRLSEIFGTELVEIHHIGSTSVEGLLAKPIIDILLVVKSIVRIDEFTSLMIAIGYEPRGENGLQGRRFFQKGGDVRTYHLHFYEKGNDEVVRHLAFRNYLRTHPDAAKEYGNVKKKLSQCYPNDIESYKEGKERLVSEIQIQALAWFQQSRNR